MRDTNLLNFVMILDEINEKSKAFETALTMMKKEFNIKAALKTMDEMKELADKKEKIIIELCEYFKRNYN